MPGEQAAADSGQSLSAVIARARELIRSNSFEAAEQLLHAAVTGKPDNTHTADAWYTIAVARRYQNKLPAALTALSRLLVAEPEHARAHQERGHCLLALNNLNDAQHAYERAAHLNPGLHASWAALINLYGLHDLSVNPLLTRRLQHARAQHAYLTGLPPALRSVVSLIHEQQLDQADRLCRQFLRQNKQHVEGMRLLAKIGESLEILTDAEFLLETALELDPANVQVRFDYANLLLKMQKFEDAYTQTGLLLDTQPDDLATIALHGNAAAGMGDHEAAIRYYNHVIERSPGQDRLLVMRGHAEKTIGNFDAAIASYKAAYAVRAEYGDAYWSLANTKTYTFTDTEIATMQREESAPSTSTDDRIHLCFALGKALEDRRKYAAAFRFYERGNALKLLGIGGKNTNLTVRISTHINTCTPELFAAHPGAGCTAPDPIFIVGLPRAGSTLLEQILASHSMVDGTMELPNIIALAQRLRKRGSSDPDDRYPGILHTLSDDYFRQFGEQFIEQTRVYRAGAPLFIDKNPNNFFHIGLIRLILPNAKIIDARRHPMACCFSGFKQLFGQGQEFTYGLTEIGSYYREYVQLMQHWNDVLPGFVLLVKHEDVVTDLETQVRRMLDFCGLPFEAACLEFYNNRRSVRTPSSEQVRQPIYHSGLDAWKPFEPWLDPLKDALGEDVRAMYNIEYN